MKSANKVFPFTVILLVAVFADQISKFLASKYFFVSCNKGGVFGFGSGGGSNLLVSLASFAILIYLGFLALKEEKNDLNLALILVLSGGISNLLDRLAYGCVRDFIQVFKWFPAFNLADTLISIGALLFIFSTVKNLKKHE